MNPIIERVERYMWERIDESLRTAEGKLLVEFNVDQERLIKALTDARAFWEEGYEDAKAEVGNCDGCAYSHRKRHQKCSCCRRNPYLKDCYEEE